MGDYQASFGIEYRDGNPCQTGHQTGPGTGGIDDDIRLDKQLFPALGIL